MDNNKIFTKGDVNEVVKRLQFVNTIKVRCPINDTSILFFWGYMSSICQGYVQRNKIDDENFSLDTYSYNDVPVADVFDCFMRAIDRCKREIVDMECLCAFRALLFSFRHLKYVNIEFIEGQELVDNFKLLNTGDIEKIYDVMDSIYKIEMLEFNLHDMFSQEIIDMLNKSFMIYDIIKNSYLEREFMILFSFDDYMTYMQMLINNNLNTFESMDENIIKYLQYFPKVMQLHKPDIKIITDYPTI